MASKSVQRAHKKSKPATRASAELRLQELFWRLEISNSLKIKIKVNIYIWSGQQYHSKIDKTLSKLMVRNGQASTNIFILNIKQQINSFHFNYRTVMIC